MFGKKMLLSQEMTVGEFDIEADGAYRNVKSFPLTVKSGKDLFVSVDSDKPVDIAVSNEAGKCIGFKEGIQKDTFGPTHLKEKETLALVVGVFRGDLAKLKIEVWME